MRKRIALLLALCLLASLLAGCGRSPSPAPTPEPSPAPPAEDTPPTLPSEAEQREIFEQNRALWAFTEPWDSPWFYTFVDLDSNGLLEVLAATTQGSGMFTYAHYYEINRNFNGVVNCYHRDAEIEGPDDWPEIVMASLPCYHDIEADRFYYACEGVTRDGFRHQYLAWYALCLYDGVADWEFIASKDVEYREDGGESVECRDAQGGMISEQDYDSAVERRFAGLERSELTLDWTRVENPMP